MNKPFTIKLKPIDWKPHAKDPDYQGCAQGFIKSFKRDKVNGRLLKQTLNNEGYLEVSMSTNGKVTNKLVHLFMADCFLEYPKGATLGEYTIDHKDQNKLNNNLINLHYVTSSEQNRNKPKQKGCTSIYKGVYKCDYRWRSSIKVNGKMVCIGTYYSTELEAGKAYNDYVIANKLPNILNVFT